jgi:hypothetical protein
VRELRATSLTAPRRYQTAITSYNRAIRKHMSRANQITPRAFVIDVAAVSG